MNTKEVTIGEITFGHGLAVSDKNVVSVNSVENFDGDVTLPITAQGAKNALAERVGNVEALLQTI